MLEFEELSGHRLWVPGKPKPKERPRMGRGGHFYTPRATKEAEAAIAGAWKGMGGVLLDGPVEVILTFDPDGTYIEVEPYEVRPSKIAADLDNLAKLVLDALNGVAYTDDKHIHRLVVRKG
jgi:Holliday junction resolvase RusA-like endonuclease